MADVRYYTHEKLGAGVQILATHPGRVKERLIEAIHKSLFAVDPAALSEPGMDRNARAYWDEVWVAVTTAPPDPARGVYEPSIERLTEAEASRLAQLIVTVDSMVGDALRQS